MQSGGHPIRVFYAFDPRRTAILLIGGDKTGDDRFYERMVPVADRGNQEGGTDTMTGRRPFTDLTKGFTPERRARTAAKAAALREEMSLEELRKARNVSQEALAETLDVGQPAVAKLEKRADIHVSNLRRYVEALGGKLDIMARFPEASVSITNLGGTREAS